MKTRIIVFIILAFLGIILFSGLVITFYQNTLENIIISISSTLTIIILIFTILGFENIHKYFIETFFFSYNDDLKTVMSYLSGVQGDIESMKFHYERFNEYDYYGNEAFYYGNLSFINYDYADAINKISILKSLRILKDINSITRNIILLNIIKIGLIIQEHGDKYDLDIDILKEIKKAPKECPYYYKIMIENDQMKEGIKRLTRSY